MIDRKSALKLRSAMKEINDVLKKHGLHGDIGTIRYNASEMRTKLTVVELTAPGQAPVDNDRVNFETYCKRYGFNLNDYRRTVKCSGIVAPVKLVGFKPNSYKYPILVETLRGKRYKVQKHMITV